MVFEEEKYYRWTGNHPEDDDNTKTIDCKKAILDRKPRRVVNIIETGPGGTFLVFEGINNGAWLWQPENFEEVPSPLDPPKHWGIVNIEDAPVGATVRLISVNPGDPTSASAHIGEIGTIKGGSPTFPRVKPTILTIQNCSFWVDPGAKVELLGEYNNVLDDLTKRALSMRGVGSISLGPYVSQDVLADLLPSFRHKKKKYEYTFEPSPNEIRDEVLDMIRLDQ
jgi:hypothetical protein